MRSKTTNMERVARKASLRIARVLASRHDRQPDCRGLWTELNSASVLHEIVVLSSAITAAMGAHKRFHRVSPKNCAKCSAKQKMAQTTAVHLTDLGSPVVSACCEATSTPPDTHMNCTPARTMAASIAAAPPRARAAASEIPFTARQRAALFFRRAAL